MATQREIIAVFMKSLDTTTLEGEAALDEAISKCSTFNSFAELKAAMINDINDARSGDDFLKRFCGIDYNTDDTGAITGSDAGGSTSKDKYNVVPEVGDLDTSFTDNEFTVNGLKVTLADERTFDDLNSTEQFIWQGLHSWWIKAALDLIAESYGDNYSFNDSSSATVKEISIKFYTESKKTLAITWRRWLGDAVTSLRLDINMYNYDGLENDLDKAKSEFGYMIAHEFTHVVMNANLLAPVLNSLPIFVREGLAELTVGAEKFREYKIPYLAEDSTAFEDGLDINNKNTSEDFVYAGGYMFFRYLARHAGDITISNSDDTLVTTFDGNDTINNSNNNVSIVSGAGGDSINTNGSNVTIIGGKGRDFINNIDGENVTFQYNTGDGKDSIKGFNETSTFVIDGGKGRYSSTVNNDNLILTIGNNKVTLDGVASLSNVNIDGIKQLKVTNSTRSSVTADSTTKIINASTRTKSIKITGNDLNNTISGGKGADKLYGGTGNDSLFGGKGNDTLSGYTGNDKLLGGAGEDSLSGGKGNDYLSGGSGKDKLYGGKGKDTLIGGKGNDSLWGDSGADTFLYAKGDGKDVIYGYDSKDTLILDGLEFTSSYNKNKGTLALKFDSGSITLKEFTATTFHIDNDIYKISSGKFVRK